MNQRTDGQVCKGLSSLYQKKSFEDDKNTKLQIAKILFTSLYTAEKGTRVADVLASTGWLSLPVNVHNIQYTLTIDFCHTKFRYISVYCLLMYVKLWVVL